MMHNSIRFALFLIMAACSGCSQNALCPDARTDPTTGAIVVQPEHIHTPYLKEKFCIYASQMAATCELALCVPLDKQTFEMSAQREGEHHYRCLRRDISKRRAAELLACLKTVTKCSQLHHCVGDLYQSDPKRRDEEIGITLIDETGTIP